MSMPYTDRISKDPVGYVLDMLWADLGEKGNHDAATTIVACISARDYPTALCFAIAMELDAARRSNVIDEYHQRTCSYAAAMAEQIIARESVKYKRPPPPTNIPPPPKPPPITVEDIDKALKTPPPITSTKPPPAPIRR